MTESGNRTAVDPFADPVAPVVTERDLIMESTLAVGRDASLTLGKDALIVLGASQMDRMVERLFA